MLFGCKFDAPFDHFLWQGNWHGKYKLVQFYWMLLLSLSSSLLIKIHCCVAYKFQHQAQWKFNTGHKIFYHYVCIILNNTTFHLIHIAQFARHFPIRMKFWQICMYSIAVIFLKCWPFFTWHFGRPKLWQASSRFLNKSINALLQEVSNYFCVTRSRRCMYM